MRSGACERVILGGPPEIVPRLESSHMSNPARADRGAHRVEVPTATPDAVRHAATAVFEQHERDRELLERLAAGLARGERAVAGADAVRDMLVQRRVETLLYDEQHAPPDSVLERAIEVAQSAEIVSVRRDLDALERQGHIAALLRF